MRVMNLDERYKQNVASVQPRYTFNISDFNIYLLLSTASKRNYSRPRGARARD